VGGCGVRKTKWLRSAILAAAALAAAPMLVCAQEAPAVTATTHVDLQKLEAGVFSAADPGDREEAARRLISRHTPESIAILLRAINEGDRFTQIAAARAIASDRTPDTIYIEPLGHLLGTDRTLTEAVSQALATYKGAQGTLDKLARFANNYRVSTASQVVAIRALGKIVARPAAQVLVEDFLLKPDVSDLLRNAAMDSLVDMTGLTDNARDMQRWSTWWDNNKAMSDADFARGPMERKADQTVALANQMRVLVEQTGQVLKRDYLQAAAEQKPDLLLSYLQNEAPAFRLVGVQIVYSDFTGGRAPTDKVIGRLRGMVGDSSTDVRQEVARALGAINDTDAVDALLAQLAIETDANVRAAMAAALGPIQNVRAVDPLVKLLQDDSYRVVQAAAESLRDLGPVLRKNENAKLVGPVAVALRGRLQAIGTNPAGARVRESLVEAMATLRDADLLSVFYSLLDWKAETPNIRRAAIKGLAGIGNSDSAANILELLKYDPDRGVRLEAATALAATATFAHVDAMVARLLDAQGESDSDVREQIWRVLVTLFPKGSTQELDRIADRFAGDPERRLTLLGVEERQLIEAADEENLARTRRKIGESLMKLNRPDDAGNAAIRFGQSLEYWRQHNAPPAETDPLIQQRMNAMLRAKDWAKAMQFAADTIETRKDYRQTMGRQIVAETERLREARKPQDALDLIRAAIKIEPSLGDLYVNQLKSMEGEVQRSITPGGLRLDYRMWMRYAGNRSGVVDGPRVPVEFS
jgi:HEAT repeat protein